MLKLMILDTPENSELIGALISPYYDTVPGPADSGLRGIKEAVAHERPDIILFSTDYSEFGWENVLQNLENDIEGFSDVIKMIIAGSASSAITNAVQLFGADMIVRPFDPLAFLEKLAADAQSRLPAKDRTDESTGLHKKEFTADKIRDEIARSPGTLFLIDVAKYSFAAAHMEEWVLKNCAEVIRVETEIRGGTLGIAAGGRFIGFIPGLMSRGEGVEWGSKLAEKIKTEVPEKLYVSIGLAESSGDPDRYDDLYIACDKALGLARAKNSSASYY